MRVVVVLLAGGRAWCWGVLLVVGYFETAFVVDGVYFFLGVEGGVRVGPHLGGVCGFWYWRGGESRETAVLERRSNTALEGLWLLMYMQVATKERRISRKSRTEESRTTERRRKRSSRSRSSPTSVFMPYRIRLTIFPSAAQHACGARVGAVWPL